MRDVRFSLRAMKFLELYFGGALMKDAARAAGYRGASDQSLCNTGRAVLTKFGFSKNHKLLFRRMKIAQLFVGLADDSKSDRDQLKILKKLSRYIGD